MSKWTDDEDTARRDARKIERKYQKLLKRANRREARAEKRERRQMRKVRRAGERDRERDEWGLYLAKRAETKAANKARLANAKNPALACAGHTLLTLMDTGGDRLALDAAKEMRRSWTEQRDRRFRYIAIIGTWLLLIALALSSTCCAPKGVMRPMAAQVDNAVKVTVWCVDDHAFPQVGLGMSAGSGVLVGPSTVLTAQHVVTCKEGLIALRVTTADGRTFGASVWRRYGDEYDVAALRLDGVSSAEYATIGKRPPVDASVCTAVVTPDRRYACGTITSYNDPPGSMELTIPVVNGNSGSGVYDRTGKLVAIVTHRKPCAVKFSGAGLELIGSCGGRATAIAGVVTL